MQPHARCKQKKEQGKEEDPVLSPIREDTRKETGKETPEGKDPKVPVRQATIFRRDNVIKHPHAVFGTHQNAHITNPENSTCVFKQTGKAGDDTN